MAIQSDNSLGFIAWHERQLILSFAWLLTCLLSGFVFFAIVEFVGVGISDVTSLAGTVALYLNGIAVIELFRRFWRRFEFAQLCASGATCNTCGSYGLFSVRTDAHPIYARCQKCGHQWVIGQADR